MGDVLTPAAPRDAMLADDRTTLAAGAAPGVADPAETVAHEYAVGFTEPDRPHDHMMPRAVVRHEGIQSYVYCPCGFTTGYTDSDAQAERIAAHHSRDAHDL